MKKPILLLIAMFTTFFFSQNLYAQDGDMMKKETYHELGINVTTFINEFVSLNNNDADLGDYMVTYKYHFGQTALRFGLGGRLTQLNEDNVGGATRKTNNSQFDIRVGYEWKKPITKKWAFYTGIDAIASSDRDVSIANSSVDEVTSTQSTTSFGGGPILGIQFFINSHISLGTEGSFYYRYSIISEKSEFSLNPEFDEDFSDNKSEASFGLPTALFFILRF